MIAALKDLLPRIEAWPSEDQEALVEAARGIGAERTGVYQATAEELAAIDRGLDDVRGGRLAAVEDLAKVRAQGYTTVRRTRGRIPRFSLSAFLQR